MSTAAVVASVLFLVVMLGSTIRAPEEGAREPAPVTKEVGVSQGVPEAPFVIEKQQSAASQFTYREIPAERLVDYVVSVSTVLKGEDAAEVVNFLLVAAREADLDPALLAGLVARESGFNPQAVSYSGAVGLGQLMPSTAEGLGVSDAFSPEANLHGTARYIKQMLVRWKDADDPIPLALASYKEGYYRVKWADGAYSADTEGYIQDILRARALIADS